LPIRRTASITFDAGTNTWINTVPASGNVDNIFFDGMALPVPTAGLPGGGVTPVWNGTFSTSIPNVNIQWAWGAAIFTHFTTAYNSLNVKATHQNWCGGNNGDQAGTPENTADQSGLVGGATGGGGPNFTGSRSGTFSITPVCPK
jgi:hypothetical protein